MDEYKHYIRLDNDLIIKTFSSAFEQPQEGDVFYCWSNGRHFNIDLFTIQGIPKYKFIDGEIVEIRETLEDKLKLAKQNKILELNNLCSQTISSTFNSSALGISHIYKYDKEAQTNFINVEQALKYYPEDMIIDWRTVDNGVLTHNKQQFITLFLDSLNHKLYNINRYRELEKIVNNVETIEIVNSIVW